LSVHVFLFNLLPTSPLAKLENHQSAVVTLAVKAGVLVGLAWLAWSAGRAGAGKFLTAYAVNTNLIAAADMAIRISPSDADAHLVRAELLATGNEFEQAVAECERAASLRPDDYVVWLSLARVRELNGQAKEAIEAARRAVPLAPFYAQPHWLLGNVLIRAEETEEGFRELSAAGHADSSLYPAILDLAWQLSHGNVEFLKQFIQPLSSEAALALGEYLGKHGEAREAIALFEKAGAGPEAVAARKKYVTELIAAKKFDEALALWNFNRRVENQSAPDKLLNPSFEQECDLDEGGFGWRAPNPSGNVKLSLDHTDPQEGGSSLLIDFKGDSSPAAPIISQLVLIEAKTHYALRVSCRTENLVTGGPPNLRILDAAGDKILGQTGALSGTNGNWRGYLIDFSSGDSTTAIQIVMQRESCNNSLCPIFGKLWLDNFALEKSKHSLSQSYEMKFSSRRDRPASQ
jgi:tetratricopeptide (TPR) repeat protein